MKSYIFKVIATVVILFSIISSVSATEYKNDTIQETKYDRRVNKYYKRWLALIPKQMVLQYAGNMGILSGGIGWNYGKHKQWETQFLLGFINRFESHRPKMTVTLKQNYIPWRVDLGKNWILEPLECGIYFNSILGEEFWNKQPKKYPKRYYWFSTKIRPNIFLGQRITKKIPHDNRKFIKSCTFFYELSSPEIYLIEWYCNSYLKFTDVFSLSLGIKVQIM